MRAFPKDFLSKFKDVEKNALLCNTFRIRVMKDEVLEEGWRRIRFVQPSSLRINATAYLRKSRRRGRPTGGIGSLRSFVIWKNYGTYRMQLYAYRKEIREAKGKNWTSVCSDIEKGAEPARLKQATGP